MIGEVLPLAVGIAVSPILIIAAVLMPFSTRAGEHRPVAWVAT